MVLLPDALSIVVVRGGLLAAMDDEDIFKIGFFVVAVAAASAIVGWDPRIFFPQYQEESQLRVETEENLEVAINVTSIYWGTLPPGGSAERAVLIMNTGDLPGTLSLRTGNFSPIESEQ